MNKPWSNEPTPLTDANDYHSLGNWQPESTAPKDCAILAAWGTKASGAMGYDIVKWGGNNWLSENGDLILPADGYSLIAWMPLPPLPK